MPRLATMTSPVSSGRLKDGVAVVPIGSVEQHGPHLPLDTDIFLASAVAEGATAHESDRAVLCPSLSLGISEHHINYPGTLSLRHETLDAILQDVIESLVAHGCRRILLLNGHGGNTDTVMRAVQKLGHNTPARIVGTNYMTFASDVVPSTRRSDLGGMSHGGEFETSLMLHCRPETVRMNELDDIPRTPRLRRMPSERADIFESRAVLMDWRTEEFSRSGVMGRPDLATADNGKLWFDACVDGCAGLIQELASLPTK